MGICIDHPLVSIFVGRRRRRMNKIEEEIYKISFLVTTEIEVKLD